MSKYLTKPIYKILIAIFCAVLWGSAFPVLKLIYEGMSLDPGDISANIVLAGSRFFVASLLLFGLLKFVIKQPLKVPDIRILPRLILLGILLTTLQYFFFYIGLAHTSGSKGAIIMSSDTFFIILFAHFIYSDDRMNWRKLLGLTLGFIGIVLINREKGGLNFHFSLLGEGFLILAAVSGALGILYAKKLTSLIHPFLLTAWQMLLGSILLLAFGLTGLKPGSITVSPTIFFLFFYSAVLSAGAFSLWNSLMKYNKAGEISMFKFMTPISGAALSIAFLPGEVFNMNHLISLVFVSAGIAAVHYNRSRPPIPANIQSVKQV